MNQTQIFTTSAHSTTIFKQKYAKKKKQSNKQIETTCLRHINCVCFDSIPKLKKKNQKINPSKYKID